MRSRMLCRIACNGWRHLHTATLFSLSQPFQSHALVNFWTQHADVGQVAILLGMV